MFRISAVKALRPSVYVAKFLSISALKTLKISASHDDEPIPVEVS